MARLARIVIPNCPHHVTARGNRREPIFFEDGDQDIYCDMLAEQMRKADVEVWAYCLMPNHVHLTGDRAGNRFLISAHNLEADKEFFDLVSRLILNPERKWKVRRQQSWLNVHLTPFWLENGVYRLSLREPLV